MENVYPAVKNTVPACDELLKLNLFWSMIVLLRLSDDVSILKSQMKCIILT